MPFMKGKSPIRRTIQYLEAGKLVLKDPIKVLTVNYNIHGVHHQGTKYWPPNVDRRSQQNKEEIHDHLIKVVGKTEEVLKGEALAKEKKDNPANFGSLCDRYCICELPGQLPCPGTCPVPKHMRGKYKFAKQD